MSGDQDSSEASPASGSAAGSDPERRSGWLRRELIVAGVLIPAGVLLLPIAIYFIGQALLGEYSDRGDGIGRLYGDIFRDVRSGSPWAIILILSPWLGLQILRIAIWLPRITGRPSQPEPE